MLTLSDGRSELWQWDTGRTLSVDADCSQVHFINKVFGRSIDVDVIDGVAIIPDILLQTDKDLNVLAFVGTAENGYTKISKTFKVNRRNKPADYVFTPPDQTTLQEIEEKIKHLESIQDPDAIKNAVEDYLQQNPVESPVQSVNGQTGEVQLTAEDVGAIAYETDPTVPDWAKQPQKPTYTAAEVGALPDTYTPPNQTAQQVGADPTGTAAFAVSQHNTDAAAHNDLRLALQGLSDRINAALDSDDTTLDQMSEVVAYIKSNKSLIDAITTSKVSVADIVNDLVTNVTDKPLSAAQGVAIKTLIDGLRNDKLDASELTNAVNTALSQAKASGEFDGQDGATPNIQIGTVKTLAAGSHATASMGGTPENPLLNLGIPQGTPGSGGSGIAVSGATVGQTVKISAVDDNGVPTAWEAVDLPSGGGADYEYVTTIKIEEDGVASCELDLRAEYREVLLTTQTNITQAGGNLGYPGSSQQLTTETANLNFYPFNGETGLISNNESAAYSFKGKANVSANRQYSFRIRDTGIFLELRELQMLISGGQNLCTTYTGIARKSLISNNARLNKIKITLSSPTAYFINGLTLYVYGVRA